MNTAEQILVIILSAFLALFLFLAIVATVAIIKLVKKLTAIAESAQSVTQSISSAAEMFGKAAGPIAYGKGLVGIINAMRKGDRKRRG